MLRTDEGSSERSPRRIAAGRGAFITDTADDWLAGLLASNEVAACVIEVVHHDGRADHRYLATSPGFERSTGLGNVVGRSMRELRPDHEEFWFDLFDQVARTGEPVCFEHPAIALERRLRGHAFRIGGPDSFQVVVILAVTLDGGEEGLERFGATLAHELRSPLASMKNGLQVIKQIGPQNASSQWTVAMMERQIARLSGLIDDMLDIGRLGCTEVRLQREIVDLHHVVSESIEACGAQVEAKRHAVAIDSDGFPLHVRVDARRLVQVFTNLLSNAIKYTPSHGSIHFRLYREGDMAVAEVRDNGMGIAPEDLPHVFDLYNQATAHRLQAEGGLGIGLAIVRSIVRLHGGCVSADSEGRQKGSTFTVRLPLAS